jgi:hypothetical protein
MGWLMRYPKLRAVVFLVLAILGIALSIYDWYVGWTTPDAPELLTLSEAVQRTRVKDWLWVELQDAERLHWDCHTAVLWETTGSGPELDRMDVVITDPSQSVIMVVTFSDPMPCNELAASQPVLSGSFSHLDSESYDYKNFEGRLDRYPRSATFVDLHTNYTHSDSGTDVVMVAFTIFCLLGSLQGFYAGFILKREPESISSADRDSSLPPSFDRL